VSKGSDMDLDGPARYFHEVTRTAREAAAKEAIEQALGDTQGNVTRAAEELELSRSHLRRLLKAFGLEDRARELRLKHGLGVRVTDGPLKGRVMGRRQA